jgi:hypothetical protein
MAEKSREENKVRIAGREVRIYAWECLRLFQNCDQIILSTSEKYIDKTNYIINVFNCLGIVEQKNYRTILGKRKFEETTEEVINEKTGRMEKRTFFQIGLTKVPELFMYTDPDKEIVELDGE